MPNLAVDNRGAYSDECLSADAVEVVPELVVELEERRMPVALSWLVISVVSAFLWIAIAGLGRLLF